MGLEAQIEAIQKKLADTSVTLKNSERFEYEEKLAFLVEKKKEADAEK